MGAKLILTYQSSYIVISRTIVYTISNVWDGPKSSVALMSWFPWVGFFLMPGERSHFVPLFDKNTGVRFFHLTDGFRYYSAAGDLVHLGEMSLVSHFPGFFGGILAAWCVLNKQTKAKTNGCSESVIH